MLSNFVIALGLAALLTGCGSGGDTPSNTPTSSTCYRCTLQNGALIQQSYACTASEAQQFGRRCL